MTLTCRVNPVIVRHEQVAALVTVSKAINDAIILHNFNRNLYPVSQHYKRQNQAHQ